MRIGSRVAASLISTLALAVGFTACGSSSNDSMVMGSGTAGSSASAAGSGGTANINVGSGGSSNGAATGSGANNGTLGDGGACAAQVSNGQLVPLDMYIMLDISGSMLELTANNATKWDAVKQALESFLADKDSAGLGVGLQYFPLMKPNAPTSCTNDASCGDSGPCLNKVCTGLLDTPVGQLACATDDDCQIPTSGGNFDGGPCQTGLTQCSSNHDYYCPTIGRSCGKDDAGNALGQCEAVTQFQCAHTVNCDASVYAAPAQAIATLPGAAAGLKASIDGTTPAGNTPTGPAITGAIEQATAWAKAHPDHRVVAVMATDGLPTECTPTDITQVGAIAAQGVAANPSISTFVIGVFGADDLNQGAQDNLDTIATSGGTGKAFIVDTSQDVTMQFLAALDAIRGGQLDCAFQIPAPPSGQDLNYQLVNVDVSVTGQPDNELTYVAKAGACDATTGGWYYDKDPETGATPTQIVTCPASCTAFQAAKDASVKIELGCQTKTVVK